MGHLILRDHPAAAVRFALLVTPPPRRRPLPRLHKIVHGRRYRVASRRPTGLARVLLTVAGLLAFAAYGALLGGLP
jgi:hypothetical protein